MKLRIGLLLAALAALVSNGASAGDVVFPLRDGWRICYDAPKQGTDLEISAAAPDLLLADDDDEDLAPAAPSKNGLPSERATWTRTHLPMAKADTRNKEVFYRMKDVKPRADWKGREVRFAADFSGCEVDFFIDGEKRGTLASSGVIDMTKELSGGAAKPLTVDLHVRAKPGKQTSFSLGNVAFESSDPLRFEDPFANPSWRKKRLGVEVDVAAIAPGRGTVVCEIADAAGKTVKNLRRDVSWQRGRVRVAFDEPWADVVPWEIGKPYLYTCSLRLEGAAAKGVAPQSFKFGFRELWCEGRQIYMNGHLQRFRPVYNFSANGNGAKFLQGMGANLIYYCHGIAPSEATVDELSELGIAAIVPCADVHFSVGERDMSAQVRRWRNKAAVVAMYHGVNRYCPWWTMWPSMIGTFDMKDAPSDAINKWSAFGHTLAPGLLFYSHADGNSGDIASHNLYLNFTPLQEREEWMKDWSEKGTRPYMAAEFGQPYMWSWFRSGFAGTEFLSIYFGDRAYAEETDDCRRKFKGQSWGADDLANSNPVFWDFRRLFVMRSNRAFRAWGCNGGLCWFNLSGYGAPHFERDENGNLSRFNYTFKEPVVGRPSWVTRDYDIFAEGNHDFEAFIGGAGQFTDKTHAYVAGEKIAKQVVLLWDGCGEKSVSGKVTFNGRAQNFSSKVATGTTALVPVSFDAPAVKEKTVFELVLECEGRRDSFAVEVYPAAAAAKPETPKGLKVIPPYSLTKDTPGLERLLAPKAGTRLLVMAQKPEVWKKLGFDVEDVAPRLVYPRDFAATADELSYWRGGVDQPSAHDKRLLNGRKQRGPRGSFNHAVAAYVLRIPSVPGYRPLVDCEFDLNYTCLLQRRNAGSLVTFCTMDFEGRAGVDPAATKVYAEVLRRAAEEPPAGAAAGRVAGPADAAELGFETEDAEVYHAALPKDWSVFRGIGPSILRWRDSVKAKKIVKAPAGWQVSPDGLFAQKADARTVYCALDADEFASRYDVEQAKLVGLEENARSHFQASAALSADRLRQLYARLATNLGATAGDGAPYAKGPRLPDPYNFNFW